jgi:hypothetical protein
MIRNPVVFYRICTARALLALNGDAAMVRIPSYRRHKPSKQAVATIKVNGKPNYFYLGKYGTKESRDR